MLQHAYISVGVALIKICVNIHISVRNHQYRACHLF